MYFFEHNLSIIGCLVSIIIVLTSTGFRPSAGRNVFLTSFSLFRRAMNRTSWAIQACAEVCVCDRTPLRERLENCLVLDRVKSSLERVTSFGIRQSKTVWL